MNQHLVSYIKNPELASNNVLHVIGVIQNPVRYHSIYRLFNKWKAEMLATPNVQLHVVEAVFGDRLPECAPQDGESYNFHSVKTHSEIWLKENLINIAVKSLLPKDYKYLAWVDCDISFRDPNWAQATIHQLQHYNIMQPWQSASDLDFYGNVMSTWTSFGSLQASGKPLWHNKDKTGYSYGHSGYAWACNRYFYENLAGKGLADFCPVGAGDHLMAWACVDKVDETMPNNISDGYRRMCHVWQDSAHRACGGLVGFLPGRIEHHFHGPKQRQNGAGRAYWGRWDILTKCKPTPYDPYTDIAYDSQGVMVLCGKNKKSIEHGFMRYNRQRLTDSIES